MDTERLVLRVQDSDLVNAAAGSAHLLFVTDAALRRSDPELEALLAVELSHHRGLHPVATAIVWWLSLRARRWLPFTGRYAGSRLTRRVRPRAVPVQVLLVAWQVSVMWLYYIGKLLALRAGRVSEYVADRAAADWGYGEQLAGLYVR